MGSLWFINNVLYFFSSGKRAPLKGICFVVLTFILVYSKEK